VRNTVGDTVRETVRTQEKHSEKHFTVGEIGEGDTPPAAIPTLPPTAAVGKRRPDASGEDTGETQ
jgi:hypothetical protein